MISTMMRMSKLLIIHANKLSIQKLTPCFIRMLYSTSSSQKKDREKHEKAEKIIYETLPEVKVNKTVNYIEKLKEHLKRPDIIDENQAKGTQGLSEEEFRKDILEKRLDIEFGTGGSEEVIESSKEKIEDEEYQKHVPLNEDRNY